LSVTLVYVDT
jgi:hypothetical protein